MKQIILILKRELLVNLKQKSFLIVAVLSPLLFIIPISISMFSNVPTTYPKTIIILDESNELDENLFKEGGDYIFQFEHSSLPIVKNKLLKNEDEIFGAIYIPKNYDLYEITDQSKAIQFFTAKESYLYNSYKQFIESTLKSYMMTQRLKSFTLSKEDIDQIISEITIESSSLDIIQKEQRKLASTVAYIVGLLMYIMFILYNNSLMKSIMEEKNNKIVDVLSLVVKPVYLIVGKIIGTACVALFQLIIWICAFLLYIKIIYYIGEHFFKLPQQQLNIVNNLFDNGFLPLWKIYTFIPVFFFLGILINGSLTALITSIGNSNGKSSLGFVNNIINIVSIYLAMFVATKPESIIADIFIYVPFFTPVLTPTLIAYNLSLKSILISLTILCFSIFVLIYFAGIVYKISILSNGRKTSTKTLIRWKKEKRI